MCLRSYTREQSCATSPSVAVIIRSCVWSTACSSAIGISLIDSFVALVGECLQQEMATSDADSVDSLLALLLQRSPKQRDCSALTLGG